jgi:hypothetical protein
MLKLGGRFCFKNKLHKITLVIDNHTTDYTIQNFGRQNTFGYNFSQSFCSQCLCTTGF